MRQADSPYAKLHYDVRKRLKVTITEYCYLDMINQLCQRRWCYKSLEKCADDIGLSKRGVLKMRDRLITRGYIEKNNKGHLRTTRLYTEVAVNSVHRNDINHTETVNSVPKSVNSVHQIGELSSPKIKRDYKENIANKETTTVGYELAASVAARLKGRSLGVQ